MVAIPVYQTKSASIDVGNGVNLPAFDQSLARSIEGLGVSISDVAKHIQTQSQQKSVFSAEQGYLQFQNQMQEAYNTEFKSQMPVAGEGLHDNWLNFYDKKSQEFLSTVPPDLQPQYAQRTATLRTDWSGTAAVDQINARNGWFKDSLKTSAAQLETEIRRNGAVNFDQFRSSGDTLIENSPLSPAEKSVLKQQWHIFG